MGRCASRRRSGSRSDSRSRGAHDRRDRVLRLRGGRNGSDREPGRQAACTSLAGGCRCRSSSGRRSSRGSAPARSTRRASRRGSCTCPGSRSPCPRTPDAYGLMRSALRDRNPVLFVENVRLYGSARCRRPGGDPIPFGRPVRPGRVRTSRSSLSNMVDEALAAADALAARGISIEVIDPRTIAPLDMDTILASLARTGKLVVCHVRTRRAGSVRARRALHGAASTIWTRRSSASLGSTCRSRAAASWARLPERRFRCAAVEAVGGRIARVTRLTLPLLSISMEEGTVLAWLVDDGGDVTAGTPVVEIETDKRPFRSRRPRRGVSDRGPSGNHVAGRCRACRDRGPSNGGRRPGNGPSPFEQLRDVGRRDWDRLRAEDASGREAAACDS